MDRIVDVCFEDDGFSTVGVVLALLITLSLIFASAQVYRINSASSSIQETADAAALAAENVVAEYLIAVRICDAVVLSMGLTGTVVMGAGVVALCLPATAVTGGKLISLAKKTLDARDRFAQSAAEGLNALQRSLTFLAAANAMAVVAANSEVDGDAGYFGFAILLPTAGEEITVGGGLSDEAIEQVEDSSTDLEQAAAEAEEAAEEANAAKEKGFLADCGNNPGYCMYERAKTLAALPDPQNPLYRSVDTWSFSVALKRAQAYYPARLAAEAPASDSTSEQVLSALRKRFYTYAVEQIETGYVADDETGFSANFPLLPRNTAEMRETELYTDSVYPVTEEDGVKTMHAFSGCPNAGGSVDMGSIADMEEGHFEMCEACKFKASSLGKVAAASSSIENGFEYHYRQVAEAAAEYQLAREKQQPAMDLAKGLAGDLFDTLGDLMSSLADMRIEAQPPGRYGSVAIVATTSAHAADEGFESSFVQTGASLGTRTALSSAVLAEDEADESSSVITSLLDGLDGDGTSLGVAGTGMVLDAWSSILFAYTQGQEAVDGGLRSLLGSLPLIGASGLGEWAADTFTDIVSDLGLAPVELGSPKPMLANSVHALSNDDSALSARFLSLKAAASELSEGNAFSGALSLVESAALKKIDSLDGEVVIATVEPFGDSGPSLPITLALPSAATETAAQTVSDLIERLKSLTASISGMRQWE